MKCVWHSISCIFSFIEFVQFSWRYISMFSYLHFKQIILYSYISFKLYNILLTKSCDQLFFPCLQLFITIRISIKLFFFFFLYILFSKIKSTYSFILLYMKRKTKKKLNYTSSPLELLSKKSWWGALFKTSNQRINVEEKRKKITRNFHHSQCQWSCIYIYMFVGI